VSQGRHLATRSRSPVLVSVARFLFVFFFIFESPAVNFVYAPGLGLILWDTCFLPLLDDLRYTRQALSDFRWTQLRFKFYPCQSINALSHRPPTSALQASLSWASRSNHPHGRLISLISDSTLRCFSGWCRRNSNPA
jgi:hypothetical protein